MVWLQLQTFGASLFRYELRICQIYALVSKHHRWKWADFFFWVQWLVLLGCWPCGTACPSHPKTHQPLWRISPSLFCVLVKYIIINSASVSGFIYFIFKNRICVLLMLYIILYEGWDINYLSGHSVFSIDFCM